MTTELTYLALITTFTAVMWIPYILNRIMVGGVMDAVGYPDDPKPLAPWAARMKAAHSNAVENLVIFAILVLIAHTVGVSNGCTVAVAAVYFWARVAHFLAYTFRIPWVRTITFTIGWIAQMALAWHILV